MNREKMITKGNERKMKSIQVVLFKLIELSLGETHRRITFLFASHTTLEIGSIRARD